jgi:hypothetical protein
MKMTSFQAMFLLHLCCIVISAKAKDGQMIRGSGFEGMIGTPAMLSDFRYCEGNIFSTGLWTPSPTLVRQAEARFIMSLGFIRQKEVHPLLSPDISE